MRFVCCGQVNSLYHQREEKLPPLEGRGKTPAGVILDEGWSSVGGLVHVESWYLGGSMTGPWGLLGLSSVPSRAPRP